MIAPPKISALAPLLFSVPLALAAAGPVKPAAVFGDHMVLQQGMKVPVWGTATAGDSVTVVFAGQSVSGTADVAGNWRVTLGPLKASAEPATLTVKSSGDGGEIAFTDVLVGEVWVGSGQSNMAGTVSKYAPNDETLADLAARAPFPEIRLIRGGPAPAWEPATAESVAGFSALLFPFGERLQAERGVPVGLMLGAVGGTPSGSWIPKETYDGSDKCRADIEAFARTFDPAREESLREAKVAAWEKAAAAAKAKGEKPRGRPPGPVRKPGETSRGGAIGGLYERYISMFPGYAIRGVLWDQGEAGSGVVGVDQHTMMSELIRGWREAWGQGEFPFLFVQKPSGGGCGWPASGAAPDPVTRNASACTPLPPNLATLGGGDAPFLYVRLMADNPNAWMVPVSDLGGMVHPTNKWGYGRRAAEVALQKVYETGAQAYGPRYRSHRVEGDRLVVEFDEVGRGLAFANAETLQGFAIAGADEVWAWADATIAGDTVVLTAESVPEPRKVRYAWAQNRPWANLFNQDGKPALVFEAGE